MEDPSTYSVKEFFHDDSFEDYDIRYHEALNKAVKEDVARMQKQVANLVMYYITLQPGENMNKFKNFYEAINLSEYDALLLLHGEYPLDLKIVCEMEAYFGKEIFKVCE